MYFYTLTFVFFMRIPRDLLPFVLNNLTRYFNKFQLTTTVHVNSRHNYFYPFCHPAKEFRKQSVKIITCLLKALYL